MVALTTPIMVHSLVLRIGIALQLRNRFSLSRQGSQAIIIGRLILLRVPRRRITWQLPSLLGYRMFNSSSSSSRVGPRAVMMLLAGTPRLHRMIPVGHGEIITRTSLF